jgi:hypothetical protein
VQRSIKMWEPLSERRLVGSTENLSEIAAGTAAPTFQFPLSRGSPMPRCGTTEDENGQFPSWEGKGRQVWSGCNSNEIHPGASRPLSLHATPPKEGIFRRGRIFVQCC